MEQKSNGEIRYKLSFQQTDDYICGGEAAKRVTEEVIEHLDSVFDNWSKIAVTFDNGAFAFDLFR